jgi:DNA-binding MarR family transcriptional regulator
MKSFDRVRSAGYLTNYAARLFARAIDERLRPLGLARGHMPVLFALAGGKSLSQRDLTQSAAIEQPTMAAMLGRMERDGLLAKERDPADARSYLYRLTPLAGKKLGAVADAIRAVNAAATEGFSDAEREQYLALLARVAGNLGGDTKRR